MTSAAGMRRAAGRILLVLASLVLAGVLLAAAEGIATYVASNAGPQADDDGMFGDDVFRALAMLDVNPVPLVPDETLLWRNQAGAVRTQPVNPQSKGRPASWTIRTDSRGYRGDGTPEEAGRGPTFRILCVGDSITFGFNVDQDAVWPRRLQQLLEQRHPGVRFEVINAGVAGWSWLQGLAFLETEGLALDPDLVVMGHGTNDQFSIARITDEERLLRLGGVVERTLRWAVGRASQTNLFRLLAAAADRGDDRTLSPGCQAQIRVEGSCHRVSRRQIAEAVRTVARSVAAAGSDLLVLNTDFIATAAWSSALPALAESGVEFVDLVGELAARTAGDNEARARRLGLLPHGAPVSGAPRGAVLRVLVPDPSRTYGVQGQSYMIEGTAFAQPLFDDGTRGDEKAGDGVFSAIVDVPAERRLVQYRYLQDGTTEFVPLPPLPSTLSDRLLTLERGTLGPVDEFARVLFKAEQTHPDAAGHDVIAQLVAEKLDRFETFRSVTAAGASRPVAAQ